MGAHSLSPFWTMSRIRRQDGRGQIFTTAAEPSTPFITRAETSRKLMQCWPFMVWHKFFKWELHFQKLSQLTFTNFSYVCSGNASYKCCPTEEEASCSIR